MCQICYTMIWCIKAKSPHACLLLVFYCYVFVPNRNPDNSILLSIKREKKVGVFIITCRALVRTLLKLLPFWLSIFFFFFGRAACRILVPQPEIEPRPLAMKAWSPHHWTAREFPWLELTRTKSSAYSFTCLVSGRIFSITASGSLVSHLVSPTLPTQSGHWALRTAGHVSPVMWPLAMLFCVTHFVPYNR